jgi:hypothetical protein
MPSAIRLTDLVTEFIYALQLSWQCISHHEAQLNESVNKGKKFPIHIEQSQQGKKQYNTLHI